MEAAPDALFTAAVGKVAPDPEVVELPLTDDAVLVLGEDTDSVLELPAVGSVLVVARHGSPSGVLVTR
ncbi:MAG: hypothetical protein JJU45_18085 [Acidimicrobiia bacterium]|nr:hypothetical protein [Acidimicrobiia bacterium]